MVRVHRFVTRAADRMVVKSVARVVVKVAVKVVARKVVSVAILQTSLLISACVGDNNASQSTPAASAAPVTISARNDATDANTNASPNTQGASVYGTVTLHHSSSHSSHKHRTRRPASVPWNYQRMEVSALTSHITQTHRVVVAVLDTGAMMEHPALEHAWLRDDTNTVVGFDAVDGDRLPQDSGVCTANACEFHGTQVAAIIADITRSEHIKLMPIRVIGKHAAQTQRLLKGLCFAGALNADNHPSCQGVPANDHPADIINLSLGSYQWSDDEHALLELLNARGIIVVAAAGNDASAEPFYPAAYNSTIAVGASTAKGELAAYSNTGHLDVLAPGGNAHTPVITHDGTWLGSTPYALKRARTGTSLATAHVTALAALLKQHMGSALNSEGFAQAMRTGQLSNGDVSVSNADGTRVGHISGARMAQTFLNADAQTHVRKPLLHTQNTPFNTNSTPLYVTLLNMNTHTALPKQRIFVSQGVDEFAFHGVPAGDYRVIVSTDSDHDGVLCDDGEQCSSSYAISVNDNNASHTAQQLRISFAN